VSPATRRLIYRLVVAEKWAMPRMVLNPVRQNTRPSKYVTTFLPVRTPSAS
jgi:hypothetical protein